jgi:hypothetical protein
MQGLSRKRVGASYWGQANVRLIYRSCVDLHSFHALLALAWFETGVKRAQVQDLLADHLRLNPLLDTQQWDEGNPIINSKRFMPLRSRGIEVRLSVGFIYGREAMGLS